MCRSSSRSSAASRASSPAAMARQSMSGAFSMCIFMKRAAFQILVAKLRPISNFSMLT
jgi:hypothetical protein